MPAVTSSKGGEPPSGRSCSTLFSRCSPRSFQNNKRPKTQATALFFAFLLTTIGAVSDSMQAFFGLRLFQQNQNPFEVLSPSYLAYIFSSLRFFQSFMLEFPYTIASIYLLFENIVKFIASPRDFFNSNHISCRTILLIAFSLPLNLLGAATYGAGTAEGYLTAIGTFFLAGAIIFALVDALQVFFTDSGFLKDFLPRLKSLGKAICRRTNSYDEILTISQSDEDEDEDDTNKWYYNYNPTNIKRWIAWWLTLLFISLPSAVAEAGFGRLIWITALGNPPASSLWSILILGGAIARGLQNLTFDGLCIPGLLASYKDTAKTGAMPAQNKMHGLIYVAASIIIAVNFITIGIYSYSSVFSLLALSESYFLLNVGLSAYTALIRSLQNLGLESRNLIEGSRKYFGRTPPTILLPTHQEGESLSPKSSRCYC